MPNRLTLKRVARPFGSSVLAGRSWANFADAGFAGVVVGAGGALITGAAVWHGRVQVAAFAAGFILVGVAIVLATIATRISTRERRRSGGPVEGWDGDLKKSENTNKSLASLFRRKPAHPSGADKQ